MRYFNLKIKTTEESLEKNSKTTLRDYYDDTVIGRVNNFIHQKISNDTYFFIYRENTNSVNAVLGYDEQKVSHESALDDVAELFRANFSVNHIKELEEISIFDTIELMEEGRRKDLVNRGRLGLVDGLKLWPWYDITNNYPSGSTLYDFDEYIIDETDRSVCPLYNDRFKKELKTIEAHAKEGASQMNLIHYALATYSDKASIEMIKSLGAALYRAKRLTSRRVEFISNISPLTYKNNNNRFEEIIENNLGGIVAFDLTERLGYGPEEYKLSCDKLLKLVRTHHKDCLFVFTYNIERAGFSYMLLPDVAQQVRLVQLQEETGVKKDAAKYMQGLVKKSDNPQFVSQVNEYLDTYKHNAFTLSEALDAYENFDSWCIGKEMLSEYDSSDEFVLDRSLLGGTPQQQLDKMIGMEEPKKQMEEVIAQFFIDKERRAYRTNAETSCFHMVFAGNPGTGKTEFARLFGKIAKEKGILKSGAVVEVGGNKMMPSVIRDHFVLAKGGVLFIDEAYAIHPSFVTTLIQEMENHRDEVIVILAGYSDAMKAFMNTNEGLKSRIPYWINFPDYTADELTEIFKLMLKQRGFNASQAAIDKANLIFEKQTAIDDYGNGRFVRNLLEKAIKNQSNRIYDADGNTTYNKKKLFTIAAEDIVDEQSKSDKKRGYANATEELNKMIGLGNVKGVIRKAVAKSKINKLYMEREVKRTRPSMHMVFTGNPGTAKTTVGRIFAEILRDEKVMATGNFVEVDRSKLVAPYVGQTAPLVKSQFKKAQGGVLFIDEAYSLCDDRKNSFGDEAIDAIVKEMEDHREDVVVIFAGYPEPMKEFLERNPGLSSRVAFNIEFEDYNLDELVDITKFILKQSELTATAGAMNKLKANYEKAMKVDDYGNGRYVRKMLEEAEMNLALRLSELDERDVTTKMLTTIKAEDIPEYKEPADGTQSAIGFSA